MFKCVERLQLEYAVKIWSCCTQSNINKLEKIQLTAARIATCLHSFNKSLYLKTGREPLIIRRCLNNVQNA